MELTHEDLCILQNVWMSQKAKMQLTQMEISRCLGLTQLEFSKIMKGKSELTLQFVQDFCHQLHVDPYTFLPSLISLRKENNRPIIITTKVEVAGEIQNVQVENNQVLIQYQYIDK
ncbi:helix-turn-helix domain-containing protein [Vibrio salinus]|uniref:helix-turn-helix domain-containing protein n=1 Tax=Vibrio salinus TaxID=2899784 RepID=UPI001E41DCD5|nr:helix-turn-helix transcriptional regulator [Vibrio salinus]MCE0494912.1 helix-turn-helix transcriptional regulator [Vibrio salinus]